MRIIDLIREGDVVNFPQKPEDLLKSMARQMNAWGLEGPSEDPATTENMAFLKWFTFEQPSPTKFMTLKNLLRDDGFEPFRPKMMEGNQWAMVKDVANNWTLGVNNKPEGIELVVMKVRQVD